MEGSVESLSKYRYETALEALDDYDSSKHSGVIAFFNMHYVKEGVFPKDLSKIIRLAAECREKADYLDFYIASKDEAEKQIKRVEVFLAHIAAYLNDKGII